MPRRTLVRCDFLLAALAVLAVAAPAAPQELEPKAYSASPVGVAFFVAAFARSSGDVVFDPTLPLTDVDARINGTLLATGYTFGLWNRLALVSGALPYAWGDVTGRVFEEARSVTRSGLADARFKLSVNLVGNPAMRAREFSKSPRKTILGASLTATAPAGQYDPTKLINLGTNRWSFKPEVGVAVPKGRWDADAYVGVWLFTDNPDFYPGGQARSQDRVLALQAHVSYTFLPRLWAAIDATWYEGGAARVGGGAPSGSMSNSRLGVTMSLPVGRTQSLKVAYSSGVAVRTGSNFKTFSVGWQRLWLTKP
jgi:hypothetical protein